MHTDHWEFVASSAPNMHEGLLIFPRSTKQRYTQIHGGLRWPYLKKLGATFNVKGHLSRLTYHYSDKNSSLFLLSSTLEWLSISRRNAVFLAFSWPFYLIYEILMWPYQTKKACHKLIPKRQAQIEQTGMRFLSSARLMNLRVKQEGSCKLGINGFHRQECISAVQAWVACWLFSMTCTPCSASGIGICWWLKTAVDC